MKIHHDKHHQAYVTNVNKALEGKEIPSLGKETNSQMADERFVC